MRLNREQAKHIADTSRIIAITEFGFFGYTGGIQHHDWVLITLAVAAFIAFEVAAVLILGERDA